jgi:hypothetical protein
MTGKRVVLGRRQHSMVPFRWSGAEPEGLSEVEVAEELGALWEGDELVVYDLPGLVELFQYYTNDAYLPDND